VYSQVQTIDWRDVAANGNWDNGGCGEIGTANSQWFYPHFGSNSSRNSPDCFGTYDLVFNNNHELVSNNNVNFVDVWAITFGEFASSDRTINGQGIDLIEVSFNNPRIRNLSNANHTVNVSLGLGASTEFNPVNGNLTLSGNIFTNNHFIDVFGDNGNRLIINGVINGTNGIGVQQNSIVELNAVNTYTGETFLNAGTIELGISNAISASSNLVLSGGDLQTNGFSNQFNNLVVDGISSIILGAGSHDIEFSNSSGQSWSGGDLTIEGWVGTPGASGDDGRIFIGTDENGLTQAHLSQISFDGYPGAAILLNTGELVPSALNVGIFDSFNRADNDVVGIPSSGGVAWTEFEEVSSSASISNFELVLERAAIGQDYVSYDASSLYETAFDGSTLDTEWRFNMRLAPSDPSGFNSNRNGIAFVLGSSESDFLSPDAEGYAVVIGQSGAPDPIRLVRFSGGINGDGNLTDITTISGILSNRYLSIAVKYQSCSNTWELSARDDGAASFADPTTGNFTLVSSNVDSSYTSRNLDFFGAFWNHTAASSNPAEFDNIYIPITTFDTEYVWEGLVDTDFEDPNNWAPSRTCPRGRDRLVFSTTGTVNVENISDSVRIGQWIVESGTDLRVEDDPDTGMEPDVFSQIVLTGGDGDDFVIETGATMRFDCGSTDSEDAIRLLLNSETTGQIDGTLRFERNNSGSGPRHEIVGTDPGSIQITGQVVAERLRVGWDPFGASGSPGSVIFLSGSSYESQQGGSPFGDSGQPAQNIFNEGSTYIHKGDQSFQTSGRQYANFVYDNVNGELINSGGSGWNMDTLRILNGVIEITTSSSNPAPYPVNIAGDLEVNGGLIYSPLVLSTLMFDGSSAQNIFGSGTISFNDLARVEVDNTSPSIGLILQKNLTLENDFIVSDGRVEGRDVTLTMLASGLEINVATDGQIVGTNINPGSALGLEIGDGNAPTEVTFTGNGSECLFNSFEVRDGSSVFLERGLAVQNGTHAYADNTTLQINANGFLSLDSPTYGANSRLIYNSGGNYIRGVEWTGTVDFGYPYEVIIQNGTEVELTNSITTNIGVQTDLNIGDAINGSGTLTMTNTPNFLQVEGDVNIGDGGSAGNLTLSTVFGGDIRLRGDWNSINGTFDARERAVMFNGSSLQTINNTNTTVQVFDYMIIDNSSDGVVLDGTFTELEVRGSAGVPALELLDGDLNLNGKDFFLGRNGNAIGFEIGNQAVQIFSPSGLPASFNFEGNGNKVISAPLGGSLEFDEDVVMTIASGVDFGPSITTINASLELLAGAFVNNNAPFYGPEGVLIYNTGPAGYDRRAEWNGIEGTAGFPNDVIIRSNTFVSAAAITGYDTTPLEVRRDLTIENDATLFMDFGGNGMLDPLVIGRSLILNGVLQGSDRVGGDIEISGDWIQTGEYFPNDRELAFVGTDSLQEYSATGGDTLSFVLMDNPNGLQINDNIRVSSDFEFLNGVVIPESTQTITFEDGATATGANTGSYLSGVVSKIGWTDDVEFTFPVGDYRQVTMDSLVNVFQPAGLIPNGTNATARFDVEYFHENYVPGTNNPSNPPSTGPNIESASTCNYWQIDKTVGPVDYGCEVKLYWNLQSCIEVNQAENLTVVKWTGSDPSFGAWDDQFETGVSPASGAATSGHVISGTVQDFSPFTIGSKGSNLNVLPIELIHFTAKNVNNREVLLEWSTASETNNDFFTLERTLDGENFEIIGTVDGAGNSTSTLNYNFVDDDPYSGISYYRLKQTDFDGSFEYSELRAVEIDSDGSFDLQSVYASDGGVRLIYTTENPFLSLEVFDMTGKMVHRQRIENNRNTLIHPNIARGVYLLRLSNGSQMATEKFFY